jgi:hypothetical protein
MKKVLLGSEKDENMKKVSSSTLKLSTVELIGYSFGKGDVHK